MPPPSVSWLLTSAIHSGQPSDCKSSKVSTDGRRGLRGGAVSVDTPKLVKEGEENEEPEISTGEILAQVTKKPRK